MVLLSGAFLHRFRSVGWRWPGLAEFLRVAPPSSSSSPTGAAATEAASKASDTAHRSSSSEKHTQDARHASVDENIAIVESVGSLQQAPLKTQKKQAPVDKGSIPPAVFVQPLYISKVNTCFQLLLVGGCLSSSWYAWPPQEAILVLGFVTGSTTLASCVAYVRAFLKGSIK